MLRFEVGDMSCGHCVQAITQAVKGVDGGADVTVDLAAKRVDVVTGGGAAAIAAAIREAGYTPLPLSAPAAAPKTGCCGHC